MKIPIINHQIENAKEIFKIKFLTTKFYLLDCLSSMTTQSKIASMATLLFAATTYFYINPQPRYYLALFSFTTISLSSIKKFFKPETQTDIKTTLLLKVKELNSPNAQLLLENPGIPLYLLEKIKTLITILNEYEKFPLNLDNFTPEDCCLESSTPKLYLAVNWRINSIINTLSVIQERQHNNQNPPGLNIRWDLLDGCLRKAEEYEFLFNREVTFQDGAVYLLNKAIKEFFNCFQNLNTKNFYAHLQEINDKTDLIDNIIFLERDAYIKLSTFNLDLFHTQKYAIQCLGRCLRQQQILRIR